MVEDRPGQGSKSPEPDTFEKSPDGGPTQRGRPFSIYSGPPEHIHGRVVAVVVDDEAVDGEEVPIFMTMKQRKVFVRNVFALLTCMLLMDILFVIVAHNVHAINRFLRESFILYVVSFSVFIVVFMVLVCCKNVRKKKPLNFIMLIILTVSMGFLLAMITAQHSTELVLFATTGTLIVALSMTMLAALCPCDITGWGVYLFVVGVVLITGAVAVTIVYHSLQLHGETKRMMDLGISIAFVLLYSIYLVFDVQQVLGGGRVEIDPDDYINGAIHLWIDIISIFFCLLSIGRNS